MASTPASEPGLSTRFCDPNADITLRSCDGTLFKFYRKQLESHSVAFAGGEEFPSVAGEIVDLTETSEVVELLLQLMSLEKHPNLMTLQIEFSVLAQLADAIEKYEVVSAMNICDMAMRAAIPKGHAMEVLDWAARNGYVETMDEAAPATIRYKLDKLKSLRSAPVLVAWLQYFQHWLDTLNDAHERMAGSRCGCRAGAAQQVVTQRLRARPGALLDLDDIFGGLSESRSDGVGCIIDLDQVRRAVTARIAAIPKFSSLL